MFGFRRTQPSSLPEWSNKTRLANHDLEVSDMHEVLNKDLRRQIINRYLLNNPWDTYWLL